ncbi:SRPBCC domain-containing protein [Rudaea sp.]|uniref:SRPBCC family protein n=1 Tax=Rudaea sp. TaxID=2136325 RepID=UPI00321FE885
MKTTAKPVAGLALALVCAACSHIPLLGRGGGNDAAAAPAAAEKPATPAVAKAEAAAPAASAPNAAAQAEASAADHIELKYAFQSNAAPDRVYAAITGVARWWDSSHTYSGNASNLSLDARAGGCWCEQLADGGSVQHMTVLSAMPGRMLRLSGGLGPLQAAPVTAVMTWTIKRAGAGSEVGMTYLVDGYYPGGLAKVRGDVDAVLGHQLERLQGYIDHP